MNDTEPPSITNSTCPLDMEVDAGDGACVVVDYPTPVLEDNCGFGTIIQVAGLPSGSFFPMGTTVNTFELDDESGNTSQCSFTVSVVGGQSSGNFSSCTDVTDLNENIVVTTATSPGVGGLRVDMAWQSFEVTKDILFLESIDIDMTRLPGFENTAMDGTIFKGVGTSGEEVGSVWFPEYDGGIMDFSELNLSLTSGTYTLRMNCTRDRRRQLFVVGPSG